MAEMTHLPQSQGDGDSSAGCFAKILSCVSADKQSSERNGSGQRHYQYKYDTIISPWPMLDTTGDDGFPFHELPTAEWFLKVVKVALRVVVNRLSWREGRSVGELDYDKVKVDLKRVGLGKMNGSAANVTDESIARFREKDEQKKCKGLSHLVKMTKALLKKGIHDPLDIFNVFEQAIENNPRGRPNTLGDYKSLFVTEPLPELSENYTEDNIFADLRVAGFNPIVIRRMSSPDDRFPVTDDMLARATVSGDTLSVARREGRLFLADYSALHEAEMGNYPAGPKYVFAPLALFALPPGSGTRNLVPVAIQCGQEPGIFPVRTPEDGTLWSRAKCAVQQADSNHHELVSHLGGCHLLMEPFVIATYNQLGKDHPVGHLLIPHFEGTLFINDGAVKLLLAPTAQLSQVLAPTIESSTKISVEGLMKEGYFNKHMLPRQLEEQGVMSKDLYYPYRDDALELWHAIADWVQRYVGIFYEDDASVKNDIAVQAWAKELVAESGGRVRGFGEEDATGVVISGRVTTVKYLVEALTMIIFTASASHASFHYAQLQMTFAPAVPGALYRPMPVSERQASIMPELDQFPPLEVARVQMEFLTLLGSIRYTRLGDYGHGWAQTEAVRRAMEKFQQQLKEVNETIADRNKTRSPTYTVLLPETIPQSINI